MDLYSHHACAIVEEPETMGSNEKVLNNEELNAASIDSEMNEDDPSENSIGLMKAWVSEDGTGIHLCDMPVPTITSPGQVLLKVQAASVNSIDVMMSKGYAREMLGKLKQLKSFDRNASRFPLIAGRDCCGTVVSVGESVDNLNPGDKVIAVVPATLQGTHAEYVVTEAKYCAKKPDNVSNEEAASLPYVANTAYTALVHFARLRSNNTTSTRVLIHGGAGGVGTIAIQMLKAWGVDRVVVTCSEDSFDLVKKLGAIPVDYRSQDAKEQLADHAPFDIILDCVDSPLARWSDEVMGTWTNCVHVSLISPLVTDTDKYGVILGLFSTLSKHFARSFQSHLRGRWFTYAYFIPSQICLNELSKFVEEGKIVPVVEKVENFENADVAYKKVAELHGRGKTVLTFSD